MKFKNFPATDHELDGISMAACRIKRTLSRTHRSAAADRPAKRLGPSEMSRINASTHQRINASTHQRINASTHRARRMSVYIRANVPGGTLFLTIVTARRKRLFEQASYRSALASAIRTTKVERPFVCDAIVLLPDHWHIIMTLPAGDADFSTRIQSIKRRTTHVLRETELWQPRFWEHAIRDEDEFNHLVEYIHFNPVKHHVATCPHAWPFSSFHRHVAAGLCSADWGCACTGWSTSVTNHRKLEILTGEP
jgi:putative transposase